MKPIVMMSISASIFASIIYYAHNLGLAINLTESLPRGLYVEDTNQINYNEIIKFCLPEEISEKVNAQLYIPDGFCENGSSGLLKLVLGMEGDSISIENDIIHVKRQDKNFSIALHKKEYSKKGNKLLSFLEEGIIPKGKLFVYTPHKDSFDSRYYGLIDKETVTPMREFITF